MTKSLNRFLRNVTKHQDLVVTPLVERYLADVGDIVLTPELAQRLAAMVQVRPRNRSATWSASARGQCLRRQAFTYVGVPQRATLDIVLQNLFNDGTWRHLRWQMMLMLCGATTDVEVPLYSDQYNMLGSADGLNHPLEIGVELKGSSNPPKEPMPMHVRQVHSYMLLLGWHRFAVIYEDKRSQDWREFVVVEDPALMADVIKELTYLNNCADTMVLPPVQPECARGSGQEFIQCPYRHVCLGCQDWSEAEALATGNPSSAPSGGGTP